MKRFLMMASLAMTAALAAQAADWTYFSISADGKTRGYADVSSLQVSGDRDVTLKKIWVKWANEDKTYALVRFEMAHYLGNDGLHYSRIASYCAYNSSGEPLKSSSTPSEWEEVVPDSMSERLYKLLFPPAERY